jgi:hypothetical protein
MNAVPRWLVAVAIGCLVALPNWCRADDRQEALKKAQEALKKAQQLQKQLLPGADAVPGDVLDLADALKKAQQLQEQLVPGADAVPGDVLDLAGHRKIGGYKTIDWQPSMKAAVEKAQADKKPIFVFMNVNELGKPNADRYCEGSQATLDYPLSDERVLAKIAKDYVAVHLNLTDQGFPREASGLKEIERDFKHNLVAHYAYSLSVVLTPDGNKVLGQSRPLGGNTIENFLMPKCLTFLDENLERYHKVAGK